MLTQQQRALAKFLETNNYTEFPATYAIYPWRGKISKTFQFVDDVSSYNSNFWTVLSQEQYVEYLK